MTHSEIEDYNPADYVGTRDEVSAYDSSTKAEYYYDPETFEASDYCEKDLKKILDDVLTGKCKPYPQPKEENAAYYGSYAYEKKQRRERSQLISQKLGNRKTSSNSRHILG